MKSNAIVDRIELFIEQLSWAEYDLPARKFVRELIAGMMIARSTVVTDIVRALTSGNRGFKAGYKRICRRLGEVDLSTVKVQQQARAYREIQKDTIIAIDIGDVTKPFAKDLECIAMVADGSDDHKIKPGYWLVGAVAINPWTQEKTPQPLELKMYSSASSDFQSENAIIKQLITKISKETGSKGIHTIDRGGDRRIILEHLFGLNQKFIVRLKNRHLTQENGELLRVGKHRQLQRRDLPLSAKIQRESDIHDRKRSAMSMRYGYEKVKITSLTKTVQHECYLVTAWNENSRRPIELLTSMPVESPDDALKAILGYLARWSVEETYRFLKVGSGLEMMRCFSFFKLQNLTSAVFITASLVARMTRNSSWRRVFSRAATRFKKSPDTLYNWLYRAADACANLLRQFLSSLLAANRPTFHTRKSGPYQPSLFGPEADL